MFAAPVPCRLYTCRRLKELGGKVKTKEISNLQKSNTQTRLYEFVGHKLERLASWGYVYHDRINGILYILVGYTYFNHVFLSRETLK
jgi:hypothetical protein